MCKKNRLTRLIWFVLTTLLFSAPYCPAVEEGANMAGSEDALFLDIPSVFSASKYEQQTTEAPSSVSIITASEIKKAGYRTLADLLNSVRGFYISNDQNYQYAGVRGFGRPGDYNSRLLLLIDGHRVNEETYASANIGNEFYFDLDLIDRVEIVRGPSSSLYGASAFFGVINVFTKRGRDYKGPEISMTTGSYGLVGGRLTYGQKLSSGLELLLSGSLSRADGNDWYYPEFDDPATNNGWAEGIDESGNYSFFLKAKMEDFTLESAFNHRTDGYPTAAFGTEFNDPDADVMDEFFFADLKYDHITESNLEIGARLFYDSYNYEGTYPYDWADYDTDPNAEPYILNGFDTANSQLFGLNIQLGKTLWDAHRFVLGGEYRNAFDLKQDYYNYHSRTVDPAFAYITPHVLNSDENSATGGLYLQDEYRISETIILNGGVRYDYYSSFGSTTNPRLALIYNPRSKTTLKLIYGSAYRAPNAYELFYHDSGNTQLANPELLPEKIKTYELVWEERIGTNLQAVVNLYHYHIKDLITQAVNSDGLLIFENKDEIEANGIELGLEGKLWGRLDTRLSYNYQQTEDQATGKRLSNAPEHLAKLNVNYPLWKDRLFLNIEELYASSRLTVATDNRASQKLSGAWVTNLTLYAKKAFGALDLSLSIFNLFDENYQVPGAGEHLQAGLQQAERNFLLKATYTF